MGIGDQLDDDVVVRNAYKRDHVLIPYQSDLMTLIHIMFDMRRMGRKDEGGNTANAAMMVVLITVDSASNRQESLTKPIVSNSLFISTYRFF